MYILAIACGAIVWYMYTWWAGLIALFLTNGVLFGIMSFGANECSHCHSFDTEVKKEDNNIVIYQCNKCKTVTYKMKE